MSSDPVVMALRAALSAADSVQIRIALGRRLLEIGQPGEALPELERVIAAEPANREALEAAARAALAVGDAARAQAYQLALAA
ncbi:MAG TPA: tetratricopeptide repeat protein, partial [Polyangia bacterium]